VALQVSHAAADPAPSEARAVSRVGESPKSWGIPILHRQLQGSKHRTGIAEPQDSLWKEITKNHVLCKHIDSEQAV